MTKQQHIWIATFISSRRQDSFKISFQVGTLRSIGSIVSACASRVCTACTC